MSNKKNNSVAIVDEFDVGFVNESDGYGQIACIEVNIDDTGFKFNTVIADIEGYTEKNIRLGENRGDLRVFVNKELVGEMVSNGISNHVKWVLIKEEGDLAREEILMFKDVARLVREEEKIVVEKYVNLKREIREEVANREELLTGKVAKKRGRPRKSEVNKKTQKVGKKRGPGRPRKVK